MKTIKKMLADRDKGGEHSDRPGDDQHGPYRKEKLDSLRRVRLHRAEPNLLSSKKRDRGWLSPSCFAA